MQLPPAVSEALGEVSNVSLEVPPHAIAAGNSLKLKVAKVEEIEGKHLAHLAFEDHFIFALVDENVKEGQTYSFDLLFDKLDVFDGENKVMEALPEQESLLGTFIKKDLSRTEVEFYYVINGESISDTKGNGFKINSVDGNDCYKKTYKYVFDREKASIVLSDGGISGKVDGILDFGHIKYAKVKVGEESVLLIVPSNMELEIGQTVYISLNGEDVEVWDVKNDFRIC